MMDRIMGADLGKVRPGVLDIARFEWVEEDRFGSAHVVMLRRKPDDEST